VGIPAFEQHREFHRETGPAVAPLVVLRSPRPASLRLICLPMECIDPDYQLNLSASDLAALGEDLGRLELLAVLTFPLDGPPLANLLAPIVLNHTTGRGVQSIQFDSSYPAVFPLPDGRSAPCS
jgi:flagellar assembly factor FliW